MSRMPQEERWQFWIDRGGTFTDIVARRPDGDLIDAQSVCRESRAVSPMPRCMASASYWASHTMKPCPTAQIDPRKMGTTVATNALLERKGEPTVLAITSGFADALRIAYQKPAEAVRAQHRTADAALRASCRGR